METAFGDEEQRVLEKSVNSISSGESLIEGVYMWQ
jgi:hypothetical protein